MTSSPDIPAAAEAAAVKMPAWLSSQRFKRMAIVCVVLVELLAMLALSWQTLGAYAHLRVPRDDLGWSVYQLDKEFQRLLTATVDNSPLDDMKLRAQIFESRLNIIQKDAIFADMRAGKLGVKLEAFFLQMRPLIEQAHSLGTPDEARAFSMRLRKVAPIITTITQEIDTEIRRGAVQDRNGFDQLLRWTLSLFLLLATTLLALGFSQLWHVRRLESTLQKLGEKDRGIFRIWDQVNEPLALVAIPFTGLTSLHYANTASEAAFGDRQALATLLSAIEAAQGAINRPRPHADPVALGGKFIEIERFDLGALQIGNVGQCVLLRLKDVTHQLADLSRSKALQSRLAEAEEWKFLGTAAASVVHELHQPLAAAANFLFVASDTISAQENLGNLPYLIDRSKQMLFRIEQISSQMRSLVPVSKSDWEVMPIRSLVLEARNIITASEAFAARIEIARGKGPSAKGSPVQLTQVFVNLLRNALEASDRKGQGLLVKVTCREEAGLALCEISDSAGGLPQEVLDGAFGSGLPGKTNGMGLGLAISRHLVEVNGGSLTCRSNATGGTTFAVSLPLAQAKLPPKEEALGPV